MTHIVPADIKTKRALRDAINRGANVWLFDPAIVNPMSGDYRTILAARGEVVCTNHPKRSWFARITTNTSGKVIVE